jgi:hypothetical protein
MSLEEAKRLVESELDHLAKNKEPWYFDGRNRDMWMDAFIERLRKRYQQPDRIASND